jgi:alpha,alpha-trehalase
MATELGWPSEAGEWRAEAEQRAARIRALCWDETLGFFFDYHHVRGRRQPYWSLCGYWALWAGIATPAQARRVAANLAKFEHAHGLAQTAERYPSPHPEFQWVQWGYPAGWPPMHIQTVASLDAYGFHGDAARVAAKYLRLYLDGYRRTGKLWEKFNVVDGNLEFPTERYEVQPMHGWASAVVVLLGRRVFGASG